MAGSLTMGKTKQRTSEWQDVTHAFNCKQIAYVGKDGRCYFGKQDEVVQYFERFDKLAYYRGALWTIKIQNEQDPKSLYKRSKDETQIEW